VMFRAVHRHCRRGQLRPDGLDAGDFDAEAAELRGRGQPGGTRPAVLSLSLWLWNPRHLRWIVSVSLDGARCSDKAFLPTPGPAKIRIPPVSGLPRHGGRDFWTAGGAAEASVPGGREAAASHRIWIIFGGCRDCGPVA